MEVRFGINNWIQIVSREQYLEIATKLEEDIRKIDPTLKAELILTTDGRDYFGAGSFTWITPEKLEASKRRERHPLSDLTEDLWRSSFKTDFCITRKDPAAPKNYMALISREVREPKRITFYGQYLDKESQKAFLDFKYSHYLKRKDDEYNKPSMFAFISLFSQLRVKA